MNYLNEFLSSFLSLALEMAPYLLLGFFIAGVLHVWIPRHLYLPKIAKPNLKSVFWATLFGIPLPICSCAVIPTAIALHREGASKGASVSFLISTPATGVDSILATYSLLGLPFAILRPVAAIFTSILGGVFTNRFTDNDVKKNSTDEMTSKKEEKKLEGFWKKILETIRFGFLEMLPNLAKWLFIGIALGALVNVFIPDDFFSFLRPYPFLCMLLVLLFSMPMYTCAFGSIPLALSLIDKGITPGAALVLLMAGPATSVASMLVVGRAFGKKTLLAYLASIAFGALFFGFIVDTFFMNEFLETIRFSNFIAEHDSSKIWFNILSLGILLLFLGIPKFKSIIHKKEKSKMARCFNVNGMNCNHCKMSVEKAVGALSGVTSVEANLSQKCVFVEGTFEETMLQKAISDAGFEFLGEKKS